MLKKQHIFIFLSTASFMLLLLTSSHILAQTSKTQITLSKNVYDVEWSPDSSLIAVAGAEGVSLYTPDLQPVFHSQDYTDVLSVSWKPDGTQFASSGIDGTIKIWGLNQQNSTARLIYSIPVKEGLRNTLGLPFAWSSRWNEICKYADLPTGRFFWLYRSHQGLEDERLDISNFIF